MRSFLSSNSSLLFVCFVCTNLDVDAAERACPERTFVDLVESILREVDSLKVGQAGERLGLDVRDLVVLQVDLLQLLQPPERVPRDDADVVVAHDQALHVARDVHEGHGLEVLSAAVDLHVDRPTRLPVVLRLPTRAVARARPRTARSPSPRLPAALLSPASTASRFFLLVYRFPERGRFYAAMLDLCTGTLRSGLPRVRWT